MRLEIVYIDDEQDLCDIFVDLFADIRFHVMTFTSIKAATEYLHANKVDVVFIDYRLPGTTGDKLAKKLDPKTPKILITGDLTTTSEYAFDRVFAKPYNTNEVQAVLEDYLKRKAA
jgi:DNA-binding NtrC family response regulator